tara:strand:+ start:749 stop:1282 length:534 start_codon:yes stop_codon:yes gene_type:complete
MIQVIDDFLPEEDFMTISQFMTSHKINWHFENYVNDQCDEEFNDPNTFQFTHGIYNVNKGPVSENFNAIETLFMERLNVWMWIRIKANLLTKSENLREFGYHVDFPRPISDNMTTAIYYLNTCNGYTSFIDGTTIETIGNRMVIFPTNTRHTGSTTTDSKHRVVINFNYYQNMEIQK